MSRRQLCICEIKERRSRDITGRLNEWNLKFSFGSKRIMQALTRYLIVLIDTNALFFSCYIAYDSKIDITYEIANTWTRENAQTSKRGKVTHLTLWLPHLNLESHEAENYLTALLFSVHGLIYSSLFFPRLCDPCLCQELIRGKTKVHTHTHTHKKAKN